MNLVRSLLAYSFYMIVLLAAFPGRLCAQAQKYEGMTVVNIRFEPQQQPLEGSELFEILPLRRGEPLRSTVVRASIERLFATGRYADIKVSAEPYNGGGVIITFITTNSWFIGDVSVSGRVSDPPNRGQLVNATRLDLGEPYTENALDVAIAAQKRLLEGNGLYLSSVSPTFDYDTEHQLINIRFRIDSGPRARFYRPVLLGNYKLDPARILTATRFRRWLIHTWKPVTQTRIRQGLDGVRSLYQRENRLEAKVQMESVKFDPATMRLVPTLNIDAGPRIEVTTVGAKLSKGKLRRYVPIFEEHAVDQDLLLEGSRNLRDYYQSQGYFEAQVEVVPQRVVNDKADVTYLVNTGKRHRLVSIAIKGNKYFTTDVIRERMFLQPARRLQFPHGRFSENLLRRDRDTIINLYESNGFRDVKVTSKVSDDDRAKVGDIAVTITIDEGPQYLVNHVEIIGMEKLDKSRIVNKLSSVEGQPFSEFNVAVDRDTILAQYFDNGFPRATFEWSSKPAPQPHRIDVVFTIHENQQEFVRAVVVTGLKITDPSLVSRNLLLNPGDPLSPTAMTNTQRRLYELGVFAKVDAAIENPDGETTRKFVLFNMEEAARYSMAFGVGAEVGRIGGCQTCLDAPAGTTGFSPRVSWDVTRNNIWGLGHSLTLSTRASTLEQRALLAYNWPRFRGNDRLTLSFTALYLDSRDVRTFTSKREEVAVQLFQRISKASTLFYRYSYRRVSVDEATLKISPLLINLLSQPVRVGIVSVGWVLDRRDDPVDPHKGVYNTIDIGVAEHMIGSDVNFARFLVRNATYHPIGKRLVLARSTQIGDIYAFHPNGDALNAIPLPERFYGGGGTSNRGFPENQAGPRDSNTGFPVGGTALLFNQTEMRFPLVGDNVGGVVFHDVGNIYSTAGSFSLRQTQPSLQDFNYMVHAVGIGVRYRTPIGPLRLDLAYSINPPNFFGFKGTQQDLLNAGVNPCLNNPKCVVQNISHFQYFFSIGQTF